MSTETANPAIDGIWNFRDVGGAASAVAIRPGLLFRSSELSHLAPTGEQQLSALGVTDLYDLRSPSEVTRSGADRVTGDIRVHQVPFATPPPGQDQAPHEIAYRQMMMDAAIAGHAPDSSAQIDYMLMVYREFVHLPGTLVALRSVATQLASGGTALVHCAAGKDRTGFLVGVILDAVGIGYEDIVTDYMRSNDAVGAMRAHVLAQLEESQPEYAESMVRTLSDDVLGVREEYLKTGFDEMAATYGSSVALLDAAGVDAATVQTLGAALT